MTNLSNLKRPDGAHRGRKRRGRGPGSGIGKTSGRGHKGHKARAGGSTHPWFEGGQMPLQRRVPKRGFTSPDRTVYQTLNVADLARVDVDEVTPEVLDAHGLVRLKRGPVKLLGTGEIDRKLTVRVHAVSASARSKIEAAGGTVELVPRHRGSGEAERAVVAGARQGANGPPARSESRAEKATEHGSDDVTEEQP